MAVDADATSEFGAPVLGCAGAAIIRADPSTVQKAVYLVFGTADRRMGEDGRLHVVRNRSDIIRQFEIASDLVVCGKYASYAGQQQQAEQSANETQFNHAAETVWCSVSIPV